MIDGKLWHQAKARLGSRSSRKRDTKKYKGKSALQRVRVEYEELIKKAKTTLP